MFLVFNKSKIYSYIIAVSTVVILFVVAAKLNDAVSPSQNILETGTNATEINVVGTNKIVKDDISNTITNVNK